MALIVYISSSLDYTLYWSAFADNDRADEDEGSIPKSATSRFKDYSDT